MNGNGSRFHTVGVKKQGDSSTHNGDCKTHKKCVKAPEAVPTGMTSACLATMKTNSKEAAQ